MEEVTNLQSRFVENILSGMKPIPAAEGAGYSSGASAIRASNRLMKNPRILNLIAKGKSVKSNDEIYDLKKAMGEADIGLEEAIRIKSLTHIHKYVELKSKLQGLLWEKLRSAGSAQTLSLNICIECEHFKEILLIAEAKGISNLKELISQLPNVAKTSKEQPQKPLQLTTSGLVDRSDSSLNNLISEDGSDE